MCDCFFIQLLFVTCEKDKDEPTGNNKAELSIVVTDTLLYTSGAFKAEVVSTGGYSISDHGFCYSLEPLPDKNDSVKSLGNLAGKGSFHAIIDHLQTNTKYHIRAFITIPTGTIYSQETTFTTLKTGKPLILSDSVFSITPYSAQISGTIVSDSGLVVTSRGLCWGTNPNPICRIVPCTVCQIRTILSKASAILRMQQPIMYGHLQPTPQALRSGTKSVL